MLLFLLQAWISLVLAICHGMKSGYSQEQEEEEEQEQEVQEFTGRKSFRAITDSPVSCR